MHILYITTEYPQPGQAYGGIAEYTHKTAHALVQRGQKVSILHIGQVNRNYTQNGVDVYEIKSFDLYKGIDGRLPEQFLRLLRLLASAYKTRQAIKKICKRNKISVIQYPNYLFQGLFLTTKDFPCLVCRVSSYAPLLRSTYGARKTIVRHIEDYLEYKSIRNSNKSIIPSKTMKNIYKLYENLDIEVIPTICPRINTKRATKIEVQDKRITSFQNKRYLLYFGSLSKVKGIDILARAIPLIHKKYPDVHFVIVGRDLGIPGAGSVKDYFKSVIGGEGSVVTFINHIGKDLLYPIIKNSYAVVMPSRIDNLPNSCLEAIALGVPIIGSNKSSIDEMIIQKKTGIVFENSSDESLAKAVDWLLSLSERRYLKMKEEIKKYYSNIQNEDRIGLLLDFYIKLIKEKNE